MKNKHIINIGLPRCATTWLWSNLATHPALNNPQYEKENSIMFGADFNSYHNFYSQYPVSANFNTNLYLLDTELIKQLGQTATHISFLVRDPYEWIERYYDFLNQDPSLKGFVINTQLIDYKTICTRWLTNIPPETKFKVLYYDDIVKTPKQFLSDYFAFCDLDIIIKSDFDKIKNASTHPTRANLVFSAMEKTIINQYITNFGNFIEKDVSHWYR